MRLEPLDRVSDLVRRDKRELACSLSLSVSLSFLCLSPSLYVHFRNSLSLRLYQRPEKNAKKDKWTTKNQYDNAELA